MSIESHPHQQLHEITRRLVKTYEDVSSINHLGHCPLPKYSVIIQALEDLKDVLFPGYRHREGLNLGNVEYYVGDRIDRLHDALTQQIGRALRRAEEVDAIPPSLACTDHDQKGHELATEFLSRLPAIRRVLATDVQAAYEGDPACMSVDEVIFCYPSLEAITVYRLAHELYRMEVPFIPRMMSEWAHRLTGIDIHPGATIGEQFFVDHGTGVVIGQTCEIGVGVRIYQGVTLGALSFHTDAEGGLVRGTKRHPTIEDRVVVYANATVLGGKTVVGHDSVIGSSVWLTQSVSPFTTVTMEKPKLRMRSEERVDSGNFIYEI